MTLSTASLSLSAYLSFSLPCHRHRCLRHPAFRRRDVAETVSAETLLQPSACQEHRSCWVGGAAREPHHAKCWAPSELRVRPTRCCSWPYLCATGHCLRERCRPCWPFSLPSPRRPCERCPSQTPAPPHADLSKTWTTCGRLRRLATGSDDFRPAQTARLGRLGSDDLARTRRLGSAWRCSAYNGARQTREWIRGALSHLRRS